MSVSVGGVDFLTVFVKDYPAAKRFYGDLLGWTVQDMPPTENAEPYSVLSAGGFGVAGMMNLGPQMKAAGMPPNWTGYVCVDDCDAAAARVQHLGGSVRNPPTDIPGIGRFAVVADPAGAVFIVMKPTPPDGGRPAPAEGTLGLAGWRELYGADPESGFDFYARMFGWTKDEAHDMGPMGKYQLFSNQDGQVGGMMKKPDMAPAHCWNFYFTVDDIDAAAARAKAGGAQILMGPMVVPSGDWVFQGADPQGAIFAVQGPKAA